MIEFEKLRDEILHSDRMSLTVLGYSFAISAGILSVNEQAGINTFVLLLLVQMLWILSFFYISNKRFAIHTIATYIKQNLECENSELNWETWLRGNKLPKALSMYYVEAITCSIPVIGVALFLGSKWCVQNNAIDALLIFAFFASAIISFVFFILMIKTVIDYNELRKGSMSELNL